MQNAIKKFRKIIRITYIVLASILLISAIAGYITLRINTRGNEPIFIPPSRKYIEKTFIEKYGKEMEEIAEFALTKEYFRWNDSDCETDKDYRKFVKIDDEYKNVSETFPMIDTLYEEGLNLIVLADGYVNFKVWTNYIATNTGLIYSKTGEFNYNYKSDVTFERIEGTNWYYYLYDYEW